MEKKCFFIRDFKIIVLKLHWMRCGNFQWIETNKIYIMQDFLIEKFFWISWVSRTVKSCFWRFVCMYLFLSLYACLFSKCFKNKLLQDIQIRYSYGLCYYIPIRHFMLLYLMQMLLELFYEYHTKYQHKRAQKETNR